MANKIDKNDLNQTITKAFWLSLISHKQHPIPYISAFMSISSLQAQSSWRLKENIIQNNTSGANTFSQPIGKRPSQQESADLADNLGIPNPDLSAK